MFGTNATFSSDGFRRKIWLMQRCKPNAGIFFLVAALFVGIFACVHDSRANDFMAPGMAVGELGARYHTGQTGKSFTQAIGPFVYFQTQARKGMLRPNIGVGFEFVSGSATIGQGAVSGTAYTGGIYPGLELFPLRTIRLQPFFEVHAIASWTYAALSPVVPRSDETTLGLGLGYQAGLGVDYRYHSEQRAVRLHASYSGYTAKLAGQTGFQLSCYALSLGLVF